MCHFSITYAQSQYYFRINLQISVPFWVSDFKRKLEVAELLLDESKYQFFELIVIINVHGSKELRNRKSFNQWIPILKFSFKNTRFYIWWYYFNHSEEVRVGFKPLNTNKNQTLIIFESVTNDAPCATLEASTHCCY